MLSRLDSGFYCVEFRLLRPSRTHNIKWQYICAIVLTAFSEEGRSAGNFCNRGATFTYWGPSLILLFTGNNLLENPSILRLLGYIFWHLQRQEGEELRIAHIIS